MKKLFAILIAFVVLCSGVSIGLQVLIDQKAMREHVAVAFHHQTGLDLHMEKTSFQLLPWPSFHASNVILTRSGCTPFVVARSVHADISLLAALHREISFQDFSIEGATVTLHRASEGQCSSWLPLVTGEEELSQAQAVHRFLAARWKVTFDAIHLADADISWQDDLLAKGISWRGGFHIDTLDMEGMRSESPWIDLKAHHNKSGFSLRGRTGNLHRLFSSSVVQGDPWGFSLGLTFGDEGPDQNRVMFDGTMRDPHRFKGALLTIQGQWADLQDVERLLPHVQLPFVLQKVEGSVSFKSDDAHLEKEDGDVGLADALRKFPKRLFPTRGHIQLASADFRDHVWGIDAPLHLKDIQLDADAPNAPVSVQGEASWGRFVWLFNAGLGSLDNVISTLKVPDAEPVPFTADVHGQDKLLASLFSKQEKEKSHIEQDNVVFHLKGTLGRKVSSVDLDGRAAVLQVPEFPGLPSALDKGISGSVVHDLSLNTHINLEGMRIKGCHWESIKFSKARVDSHEMGGIADINVVGEEHPLISGYVHIQHADLDALVPLHYQDDVSDVRASLDTPVRDRSDFFRDIGKKSTDIDVVADQIKVRDMAYHDVHIHMITGNERWVLEPFSAFLSDIPLTGRMAIDTSVDPMTLSFDASPIILPAAWIQEALGRDTIFNGPLQLDGHIDAHGHDISELLQGMEGQVGLSLVGGNVRKEVLAPLAGPAASLLKFGSGTMALRCVAGSFQVHQGVLQLNDFALHVKHFALKGGGDVHLNDETLSLLLEPYVHVVGSNFSSSVRVEGTMASPQISFLTDHEGEKHLVIGSDDGDDPCQRAVQHARNGHAGITIPPMPSEHSRAGDILHALGIGGG